MSGCLNFILWAAIIGRCRPVAACELGGLAGGKDRAVRSIWTQSGGNPKLGSGQPFASTERKAAETGGFPALAVAAN